MTMTMTIMSTVLIEDQETDTELFCMRLTIVFLDAMFSNYSGLPSTYFIVAVLRRNEYDESLA